MIKLDVLKKMIVVGFSSLMIMNGLWADPLEDNLNDLQVIAEQELVCVKSNSGFDKKSEDLEKCLNEIKKAHDQAGDLVSANLSAPGIDVPTVMAIYDRIQAILTEAENVQTQAMLDKITALNDFKSDLEEILTIMVDRHRRNVNMRLSSLNDLLSETNFIKRRSDKIMNTINLAKLDPTERTVIEDLKETIKRNDLIVAIRTLQGEAEESFEQFKADMLLGKLGKMEVSLNHIAYDQDIINKTAGDVIGSSIDGSHRTQAATLIDNPDIQEAAKALVAIASEEVDEMVKQAKDLFNVAKTDFPKVQDQINNTIKPQVQADLSCIQDAGRDGDTDRLDSCLTKVLGNLNQIKSLTDPLKGFNSALLDSEFDDILNQFNQKRLQAVKDAVTKQDKDANDAFQAILNKDSHGERVTLADVESLKNAVSGSKDRANKLISYLTVTDDSTWVSGASAAIDETYNAAFVRYNQGVAENAYEEIVATIDQDLAKAQQRLLDANAAASEAEAMANKYPSEFNEAAAIQARTAAQKAKGLIDAKVKAKADADAAAAKSPEALKQKAAKLRKTRIN